MSDYLDPKSESIPVTRRRALRRSSTDAERALWRLLQARQLSKAKFRRQHPVGTYVVDFFCLYHNLAVELDGSQHYFPDHVAKDAVRTRFLEANGIQVLRFSNRAVLTERGAVLTEIMRALERHSDSNVPNPECQKDAGVEFNQSPLPTGEG